MKLFRLALTVLTLSAFTPTAFAMDFACAPIKGAGMGDFDFSEICLNDQYALLKVGTFESSHHFYSVKRGQLVANMQELQLTSKDMVGTDPGQSVGVMIALNNLNDSILDTLKNKGQALIFGSPADSKGPQSTAKDFKLVQIPITL